MVALNFNSLCKEAEPYYYDFLCKEDQKLVPEFAIDHIKECKYCQEQLNGLSRVLSIAESHIEPEQGQVSSAATTMLKFHLSCIGKPVTCETVKPFLPSLLDPALEIGIPTPITAHMDNCHKCSEDLETIRRLNLNHKQLRRLSQLFADAPEESNISCTEAQNAVPSVVSIVLGETDSDILKHLCICSDCRELLYQRREMILRGLLKTNPVENKFPCEKVSARDFFDYVIPYGIDTANDQYAKFRESLTSHLRICPNCLIKMQELHKTVYGICERAESDVVTIYQIDESAKTQATNGAEGLYAGFPIRVDVKQREEEVKTEQLVPAIDFAAVLRQKKSVTKLRPLFKTGAVAAAIILMAAVLFQSIPTAKAVTLGKIYEAIEKIRNIHITTFTSSNKEPAQEFWISKTLNIYATKTANQCVLWDIGNRTKKTKQPGGSITDTARLTDDVIISIEEKISGASGLIPFNNISDVPQDAEWNRIDDKNIKAAKDIEVYDLTWPKRASNGSVVFWKWRVFADSETSLPRKVEWYQKSVADSDYVLSSTMKVEYISESEIRKIITGPVIGGK